MCRSPCHRVIAALVQGTIAADYDGALRHSYASLLIAKGLDVVFVSRQLGHSSPAITLDVYAHLFDQAHHAAAARAALEESYQTMTGTQPREPRDPASRSVVALLAAGESGPVAR